MAIKRRLGVVGAILLFTLGAASCGSDDEPSGGGGKGGTSGKGGASGKGGTSGAVGTGGKGGSSGATGSGGTMGKGGSSGGGAGGTSGAMGTAGAAGDAGPDARPDATDAAGGAAGTAGADAAPDVSADSGGTAGDAAADTGTAEAASEAGSDADASLSNVVINEIKPTPPATDWVEFHNRGTTSVDLSGWHLIDGGTTLPGFVFPAGTVIAAGGYLVLEEDADGSFTFGLGGADRVELYNNAATPVLVDSYDWTAQPPDGSSFLRCPNGTGAFVQAPVNDAGPQTKGSANTPSCP